MAKRFSFGNHAYVGSTKIAALCTSRRYGYAQVNELWRQGRDDIYHMNLMTGFTGVFSLRLVYLHYRENVRAGKHAG